MKMLLRYLSDDRNMMQFKRGTAIVGGLGMLLIMTMAVALCAMDRKTPTQGLYVGLSIAACRWLEIAIVLAVHYSSKVWPVVLIFVTLSIYVATAGTLIIPSVWIISFYWLCVSITIIGGAIEIVRRDIKNCV
jgi:hypothetical protein